MVERAVFWIITTLVGIVGTLLALLWKGQAKELAELRAEVDALEKKLEANGNSINLLDKKVIMEFVTKQDYRETVRTLFNKIEDLVSRQSEQHAEILQAINNLRMSIPNGGTVPGRRH